MKISEWTLGRTNKVAWDYSGYSCMAYVAPMFISRVHRSLCSSLVPQHNLLSSRLDCGECSIRLLVEAADFLTLTHSSARRDLIGLFGPSRNVLQGEGTLWLALTTTFISMIGPLLNRLHALAVMAPSCARGNGISGPLAGGRISKPTYWLWACHLPSS